MKMLLSSHGASPFGAERVLLILARRLRDRGHDVHLEIPHEGPALGEARALDGIRVWHSRRPRLPRNITEAVRYAAGALPALVRLRRRIRRERYDVVWVNSLFNPIAAAAARTAGATVVWHVHERNPRGPLGPAVAFTMRRLAHQPVGVSRFVAGTYERAAGRDRGWMRVLFEQFPRYEPQPPRAVDDAFVVGYVGQFEPRKRVPDLLEAVARTPGVSALLVGDGKRAHDVRSAVRRLGIDDRVTLAGFQRDVVAWYRRMDCVVIPSRDEPCPLVAFEAMSVGRPVIASDHGGHPEVLGDAGLFYPLGDTAALAERIARLRDDDALRAELRERGLRRIRRFSPERWTDEVEGILARATGERPATVVPA